MYHFGFRFWWILYSFFLLLQRTCTLTSLYKLKLLCNLNVTCKLDGYPTIHLGWKFYITNCHFSNQLVGVVAHEQHHHKLKGGSCHSSALLILVERRDCQYLIGTIVYMQDLPKYANKIECFKALARQRRDTFA